MLKLSKPFFLCMLMSSFGLYADIKPAHLFNNDMVIQRDTQAPFGAKQNLVKRFMLQVVGALMLKRELV